MGAFIPEFIRPTQGYFLARDRDEDADDNLEKHTLNSTPRGKRARIAHPLVLHIGFAICYCSLITIGLHYLGLLGRVHDQSPGIYTPARHVMKVRVKGPIDVYPNHYRGDPYFGDPSPEVDLRWELRLKHATIRISHDEFMHYNQSGIHLGDGSGYLATPTAYHDLHCIRALYHAIYPNYYFPSETEEQLQDRQGHLRHCLHNLAHSIMCNADMSIRVMRWHPKILLPSPVDHDHECLDWEAIDAWAGERWVDTAIKGMLVHPEKGEVFPQ